jgi:hypothetical protein
MKPERNPDDEFDAMLRQHSSLPTLRDEGFSSNVLAALPRKQVRLPAWSRSVFLLAGAGIGVALVVYAWSNYGLQFRPNSAAGAALNDAVTQLSNPWLAVAFAVTAATVFSALFRPRRRWL